MTTIKSLAGKRRTPLLRAGAAVLLGVAMSMMALSQPPPQVGTVKDSSHVFLQFSAGKSLVENHVTAQAYMNLIDPTHGKTDFVKWLKNAGFIGTETDWNASGQQTFVDQTLYPNLHGPGMINAYAHIIILNAADLGFIRNQYIRCVPSCTSPNPKIYTYLENYGATQYLVIDSTGTPDYNTGTTNTPEAVQIALERRSTDQRNGGRIADVSFEWAPAADGSNPSLNFGQIYPFVVQDKEVVPFFLDQTTVNPNSSPPVVNGGDCNYKAHNIKDGLPPFGIDEQYIWPVDLEGGVGNDQAVWNCKFNAFSTTMPNVGTRGANAPFPPALIPGRQDLIGFLAPVPPEPVISGQIFAPELDGLGTKPSPGVCFICHGGNIPSTLSSSTGSGWPAHGNIKEFRFLPADATNSIFGCDDLSADQSTPVACTVNDFDHQSYVQGLLTAGRTLTPLVQDSGTTVTPSDATKSGQSVLMKRYNQAVLITQGATPPKNATFSSVDGTITGGNWTAPKETDDQGTTRFTHGVEIILGWYAPLSNPADLSMSGLAFPDPDAGPNQGRPVLQNEAFVPVGWRGSSTGPAQPAGQPKVTPSQLYLNVLARSCRSCHMNRELSLDFGTEAQFSANQGNVQDYVFQPECDWRNGQINPRNIVMPLARLTWERFWNGIRGDSANTPTIGTVFNQTRGVTGSSNDSTLQYDLGSQVNLLKAYFGQTPTSYCAHQH